MQNVVNENEKLTKKLSENDEVHTCSLKKFNKLYKDQGVEQLKQNEANSKLMNELKFENFDLKNEYSEVKVSYENLRKL